MHFIAFKTNSYNFPHRLISAACVQPCRIPIRKPGKPTDIQKISDRVRHSVLIMVVNTGLSWRPSNWQDHSVHIRSFPSQKIEEQTYIQFSQSIYSVFQSSGCVSEVTSLNHVIKDAQNQRGTLLVLLKPGHWEIIIQRCNPGNNLHISRLRCSTRQNGDISTYFLWQIWLEEVLVF